MVRCIACNLECVDEERLERHWEHLHPSLAYLNKSIECIQRESISLAYCDRCNIAFPSSESRYTHFKDDRCLSFHFCEPEMNTNIRETKRSESRTGIRRPESCDKEDESTPLIERQILNGHPTVVGVHGFIALIKPRRVMGKLRKGRDSLRSRCSVIS